MAEVSTRVASSGPDALGIEEAGAARPAQRIGPDAKTQRYDRQLRLWASSGQTLLENASILISSATATASQSLKNLVLPGVGSFALCDTETVTWADLGHNFFLEQESLGKLRAEEVVRLVTELNPEVKGKAVAKSLVEVLSEADEDTLRSISLVIAVNLGEEEEVAVANRCWALDLPLIVTKTNGFIASVRVQVREITLVETHPDSLVDLRIDTPFPALVEYARDFNMSAMDSYEHAHVPAVVILLQALEKYKAENGGTAPMTSKQREVLKASILAQKRSADEDNFDEAVAMLSKACRKTEVPGVVQALFSDSQCENITARSTNFWLLLRALRDFARSPENADGLLPLSGALPDMKSETGGYVRLQSVYRKQAGRDVDALRRHLHCVLEGVGLPETTISDPELETFAKHAAHLRVLRGVPLQQEYSSLRGIGSLLNDEPSPIDGSTPAAYYLALRAAAQFRQSQGRDAGDGDDDIASDVAALLAIARKSTDDAEGSVPLPPTVQDAVAEIVRGGGSDLPQIAALVGGVVAQEAIKFITRQYIPLDTTCIIDGIKSTTSILRL